MVRIMCSTVCRDNLTLLFVRITCSETKSFYRDLFNEYLFVSRVRFKRYLLRNGLDYVTTVRSCHINIQTNYIFQETSYHLNSYTLESCP